MIGRKLGHPVEYKSGTSQGLSIESTLLDVFRTDASVGGDQGLTGGTATDLVLEYLDRFLDQKSQRVDFKPKANIPSLRSTLGNENGVIMTVVIMLIAFLTVVGSAALMGSRTDLKTSINFTGGTQAFYTAEAGLQAAIHELDDSDDTNDFADVSLPLTLYSASSFGNGTYSVDLSLYSSSPRMIAVASTGTALNGSSRTVSARLEQITEPPPKAIVSNNQIVFPVTGNLDLTGTCGGMHSNGDLTMNGNPSAEQAGGYTSSGYMNITGNPCIGSPDCDQNPRPDAYVLSEEEDKTIYENDYSGQPDVAVSEINPANVASRVATLGASGNGYILHTDGTVTVGGTCDSTGLCTGGTGVSIPGGWEFQSGSWKMSGQTAADGVFYVETDVVVQSSPGSEASPWQATIIARDSINYSGSPALKPYPTSDTELQGIMLMTGNDLKITGSVALAGQGGAILAHQQLILSGTITIDGYIFAGDGSPSWTGDPFPTSSSGIDLGGSHSMSGNPTIHYNCNQVNCTNDACSIPKVAIVAGSWTEF
jgi:Tfp pilus assembly protein PilX